MKTTSSIFTKIALGLLIAGSMAACKGKTADTPTTTTSAAPVSANSGTIVYINSDTLFSQYNYAKDVGKRLNDKGKTAQSDLQTRQQAFQREVADYQKNAPTMAADQRQNTEQRLQGEKQELETYQQNATAQFQNDRDSENNKLYDKISEFAKAYAKEKGYKLVLTFSKANSSVLYGDPSMDVTTDVVKRLNDAYAKDGK